ncbi:FAD-binding and (Fe-S)-binding domain-containing protein [Helicobacter ailurogastricus]|uniref:D-lactate dehydrogenase (cytochrome) n=1 Tax=Helicobacter ailurogastricus TaxID=1578720 RepID=A0A0K2Y2H8_9HELI|nr:FAD-binding and (Fe-S)-binding domain-containing protein [Helicobacter ailurogastricus]BDQ29675.1 lactate dehydrogenase [Helicobacter ailurogastricus]CRF52537.1 Predicted D-lactate dehydrogenase, Fe-S protein, FAD/FMN-containing [Helicobacter ailurogastricus]
MSQNYIAFYQEAQEFLGERIYKDYLRRVVYGIDASCYRYIPELVVKVRHESEVMRLCALAKKHNTPLTFRAAGSSLSGQACGSGVLVMANLGWQEIKAQNGGQSVRLGCGVIGAQANNALKPYQRKIGPDPATIATAMVGGILGNNASGMCCGVAQNSYKTLKSIRVVLADGTLLDTSKKESVESFRQSHAQLLEGLLTLRQEVLADHQLHALIEKKYKIKNTTGYSLNALIDFDDPIEILSHLFIGSEGTLGFISSCELHCVPDLPYKACFLLFYESLTEGLKGVQVLAQNADKISAAELMDGACLASMQGVEGMPSVLNEVKSGYACILAQLEATDLNTLEANRAFVLEKLQAIPTILPLAQSTDPNTYNAWWKIRKGLFPIVAGRRRTGTSVITEDLCFDMEHLQEGIAKLQELLDKHGFKEHSVIFGHALSGNLHFLITPLLENPKERAQFSALMEDLAHMVASLQGSIKAEHGTGRMVAPFVELEWGTKAYDLCKRIKALFDPDHLLNPDVILSNDPQIHTKNLKESVPIAPELEPCMECGFCERICPSRYLSLTPRQRIGLQREIAYLSKRAAQGLATDRALLEELLEGYKYLSDETCAACHMCSTLCPLGIDSASIALKTRTKEKAPFLAKEILKHMDTTVGALKAGLGVVQMGQVALGTHLIHKCSQKLHAKLGTPVVSNYMPRKNNYKLSSKPATKNVLYFSTCINRAFAPSKLMPDQRSLQEVFESLCKKAGFGVLYPPELPKFCCGKAFIDYKDLSAQNTQKNAQLLKNLSQNGSIPIVLDHSACSAYLIEQLENAGLQIYDMPIFIQEHLLEHLKIEPLEENIALYTMCAAKRLGYSENMRHLAQACVRGEIVEHIDTGCCGFAGNKGFLTPELNDHALLDFADFYRDKNLKKGFCSSSTCEVGLSQHSKIPFQHIAYLVDLCSDE